MSFIKRYMEQEESAQELVDALSAIIENDRLEHDVSIGIAKQIIAQRSIDELSDKQLAVFEKHIKNELNIPCEGHCDDTISLSDIPSALANEFEDGGLYCQHCCYDIRKMRAD